METITYDILPQIIEKTQHRDSHICPICGKSNLIHDQKTGETVCGSCGFVIEDTIIDTGQEWRAFNLKEKIDRSRVGKPDSKTDTYKGTTFKPTDGVSPEETNKYYRMKRWHDRTKFNDSKQRNLTNAMAELERLAGFLHTPTSIREEAALIYRGFYEKGKVRGRSIEASVGASLYAAYRKNKVPKSLSEIASSSPRDKKEIARTYRFLLRVLGLQMPVQDARSYVSKIASNLGVERKYEIRTNEILKIAMEEKETAGKDPRGIAAAALYFVIKDIQYHPTQKQISDEAGVTEVTLRNRLGTLEATLKKYDL